ncbi:hypothetical protein HCH_03209 [Hahella chejuensis KCTC 2396]|uniref:Uncharacterized protein n=1 Tax=Hahella chejuensis (strain KCTC 2396) TaxID=349521 RepID=Q2SHA4_HAHCH|nr:hypothetical protein [Hahella chejuensis]ABC29970.1 hypothetical protein HCH_03209 [Hahella chejuensis KCTC 2396]
MTYTIEYLGADTDKQTAIAAVELALLRHGDWGSYGDFAKPIEQLLNEYKITIEELPETFSVLFISPAPQSGFEVSFSVLKADLSIDKHSVVIGVDCPPPEIGE